MNLLTCSGKGHHHPHPHKEEAQQDKEGDHWLEKECRVVCKAASGMPEQFGYHGDVWPHIHYKGY